MKEFDETEAVAAMCAASGRDKCDALENSAAEVLDLIYDYYEENGELDLDNDEDEDVDAIVAYIVRCFAKNGPEIHFSEDELRAMVLAEIEYENSLLD